MKKYDSYKDSGIEWIGEIPSHWAVNKVKHNFSFKTGFTPPSGKSEYYEDGTHVWINISDLQEKEISDSVNKITDKAIEDFKPEIVQKGSLLYSFKLSVGRVGFNTMDCYTNEAIFSINPDSSTNLNFFYYSLPDQILKNANENIYGAKILNQELIKNAYLVIPPTTEQTSIANFLDLKTSEIDELIADKKRLLELYEEEKTAIINQAVTKGLDPNVPMKDSGIEWLGEIPEHWEVKKLKYVADIILGKMLTPEDKGNYKLKPYLRAANLCWHHVNVEDVKEMWFSEKELEKYLVTKNDLLVSEGGEVGRTCIWNEELNECYIQNSVHKVTVNNKCDPSYFLQLFYLYGVKGAFDLVVNKISIAHLTREKLKEVEFTLPPLSEQKVIVHHIESECSKIDFKKARTEELIELLTEYRTALISEAVTGKIKVIED
ncbi:restriction endonuclease subunit S [Proteiniphilum propionicum]|uniref:restriction endonuclease subunit S n=1 Tax=Proteiniphilum propionicum TaxID=2829812 RepID=UPI001EEC49E3|nr:restriction endonuclease subunit S [Proteiniphilum propionicum]ULB35204.1 restriction endonuclease subunit S [Proteiniphilum propionicum]